jgi:hypothetical protein
MRLYLEALCSVCYNSYGKFKVTIGYSMNYINSYLTLKIIRLLTSADSTVASFKDFQAYFDMNHHFLIQIICARLR